MTRKRVSFPTRLLTRSASTVQILTSWSSPKARSHGQGAMNDMSHDVPAHPVRNHVLRTSSAPNAPHQCGHVDMFIGPWGACSNRRAPSSQPPSCVGLRSVGPQNGPAKFRPVARVQHPCHKAETAHSKKPSHLRSWLRHIRRPRPPSTCR